MGGGVAPRAVETLWAIRPGAGFFRFIETPLPGFFHRFAPPFLLLSHARRMADITLGSPGRIAKRIGRAGGALGSGRANLRAGALKAGRFLQAQPVLGRQPCGRRHGIGALAVELAAFGQFEKIAEAFPFPVCKFDIDCRYSFFEPEIIAQVVRPSVKVMGRAAEKKRMRNFKGNNDK